MAKQIKSVIVQSRLANDKHIHTVIEVIKFLQSIGVDVYCEEMTAAKLNLNIPAVTFMEMSQKADLAIVVGGDGSMLGASREIAMSGIPVIGINRGHLGFLTDLHPHDLTKDLQKVINGEYFFESRFLISTEVLRNNRITNRSLALNEAVIQGAKTAHMIDFSIYVNDAFMYSQKADGLIISTPTGSTAYNLSAGGPIVEPSLDVISLVPMFPHSMNCRPFLLKAESVIRISFAPRIEPENITVTCDGQIIMETTDTSQIVMRKSPHVLTICHPFSYDYFASLRAKLGFASKLVE